MIRHGNDNDIIQNCTPQTEKNKNLVTTLIRLQNLARKIIFEYENFKPP